MHLRGLAGLGLLVAAGGAQGQALELALSDESAHFRVEAESSLIGYGGANLGLGLLYNEDDDLAVNLGLETTGAPAGGGPLAFTVGVRGYAAWLDRPDDHVAALALGGGASYVIPANMPMSLGATAYVAPGITTFGDGDALWDINARYAVEVTPGTSVFLGYRLLETDLDGRAGDYTLDDRPHVGVSIRY